MDKTAVCLHYLLKQPLPRYRARKTPKNRKNGWGGPFFLSKFFFRVYFSALFSLTRILGQSRLVFPGGKLDAHKTKNSVLLLLSFSIPIDANAICAGSISRPPHWHFH